MAYLVVSSHLKSDSSTLAVAREVVAAVVRSGAEVGLLDLATDAAGMPWCDGVQCYESELTKQLADRVRAAEGVVICTPIYNYSVNAGLKNFIELTDRAWADKVVGFACTAGGPASYMAVMQAANWLMLDYRCVIVPRFVYVTREAFVDRSLADTDVRRRIDELAEAVVRMGRALGTMKADR